MEPVDYISGLNTLYQSQGFPPYQWSSFDFSPWASFQKPLREATIALVSSAGVFHEDQTPFNPWAVNDLSFREIPKDTPMDRLKLHHNYFDHRDALKDLNCVFPLERLREMEAEGVIGALAPTVISLGMGRLYKRTALQQETVPRIIEVLKREKADAVLLVAA
jgi:D-proline reductase (dithiol) PrdB